MISKNLSSVFITVIGLGLLSTISWVSIYDLPESFSQSEETKNTVSQSTVHITKQSSNVYTLSDGSSQIGSFHTTYNILGTVSSLKESKELTTSTIVNDYDASPFIGYVKASNNESDTDMTGLANPFADKATINEKITSEIHSSIDSTNKLQTENAVIKCNFGMDLSKWYCSAHGLLG
ncbi:MAG: hypothetical protein ACPKPY_12295 [Nitrososphaeraceae archaeon]